MKIKDLSIPCKIIKIEKLFRDNYSLIVTFFCGLLLIIGLGVATSIKIINYYRYYHTYGNKIPCDGCRQLQEYYK